MRHDPMSGVGRLRYAAPALALGVLLATSAGAQQPSPAASAPAQATSPAATPASATALEPKAIELLKASSSRLAAARSMRFTAVVSYENPSRLGPPLVYTTRSEVTLQRPDKLCVITPGDGPASEFYYDGKTVVAFAPAENLAAVAEAPPTVDAVLEAAYRYAAIYFPFTDVVVADPWGDIAPQLELAFYIGQSREVGGTTTDMLAYASHGVFVQLWVGADDHLPRRARAVYAKDPAQMRHQVEFSNWQLDGVVPAGTFASARAASAPHIPFNRPDATPPPGATPPAAGGPAPTR
jgi:hypothetical protein